MSEDKKLLTENDLRHPYGTRRRLQSELKRVQNMAQASKEIFTNIDEERLKKRIKAIEDYIGSKHAPAKEYKTIPLGKTINVSKEGEEKTEE